MTIGSASWEGSSLAYTFSKSILITCNLPAAASTTPPVKLPGSSSRRRWAGPGCECSRSCPQRQQPAPPDRLGAAGSAVAARRRGCHCCWCPPAAKQCAEPAPKRAVCHCGWAHSVACTPTRQQRQGSGGDPCSPLAAPLSRRCKKQQRN